MENIDQRLLSWIEKNGGLVTEPTMADRRLGELFNGMVEYQFERGSDQGISWGDERKIVVASGSAAKIALVREAAAGITLPITISPAEGLADEEEYKAILQELMTPADKYSARMSARKLSPLLGIIDSGIPCLGMDTIVDVEQRVLEKPRSKEEALKMIKEVTGESVTVFNGLTLAYRNIHGGRSVWRGGAAVSFHLGRITHEQALRYIEQQGEQVLGVAGAIDYSQSNLEFTRKDFPVLVETIKSGFMLSLTRSADTEGKSGEVVMLSPAIISCLNPYFKGVPTHLVTALLRKITA